MPLKGAVIKEGATMTPSGGTDVTYSNTASTGPGVVTSVASVTDFRVRPSTIHTVKLPVYDAVSKKFGKGVKKLVHKRPKLDTDGTQILPTVRIEVEDHPIMSAAEVQALWDWIAMVATDADYASFRTAGSLD